MALGGISVIVYKACVGKRSQPFSAWYSCTYDYGQAPTNVYIESSNEIAAAAVYDHANGHKTLNDYLKLYPKDSIECAVIKALINNNDDLKNKTILNFHVAAEFSDVLSKEE